MFANFLPDSAYALKDPDAIALLQQLQRQRIMVSQSAERIAIDTAYVHLVATQATASQTDQPATPILLLHGFDSSVLEFRRLLPKLAGLAGDREIWGVDLLGFGFTASVPPVDVNPATIRSHLFSFWQTLITQPVVLVGASLGGAVAIDFALAHPDVVRSIVLIDSVGVSGSFPIGQFLVSPLDEWAVEWLGWRKQTTLDVVSALPFADPLLVDAIRCSLLHQMMPGWKTAIASFTRSGGYAGLRDRIRQITHPTLILWGESDDVLGTTDAEQFRQAIQNSRLVWVKQAGHVPHFDQPDRVATEVLAFAR